MTVFGLANYTDKPLTASGTPGDTFTGPWEPVSGYDGVVEFIATDQDCDVFVEFSPDAINRDSSIQYRYNVDVINPPHRLTVTRPYARLRIVNTAASAQTFLRAGLEFGNSKSLLSVPLNALIAPTADAIVARIISENNAVAEGLYQGRFFVSKAGRNPDVDTGSVPEDVWGGGGLYTGFPDGAAETVTVVSSDATDTDGGAGARAVRFTGLDENWDVQSETITLNGTSGATTTTLWRRIHTARITDSATPETQNAGDITFRHTTTTANVFLIMLAGTGQTNDACYTVPAKHRAFVKRHNTVIRRGTSSSVDWSFYTRSANGPFRLRRPRGGNQNSATEVPFSGGLVLGEKSDIIPRISFASANNVAVVVEYDILVVRDLAL